MVKKDNLKIFLVFIFCSVLVLSTQSQTRKYFIISGKIITGSQTIENGSIQISKNDKSSSQFPLPKNGSFRLELDYNSHFDLTFSGKGFLPKTVAVNTNLPADILNRTTNFPHFLMAVKLFSNGEDSLDFFNQKLSQKITYSAKLDQFTRVSSISDGRSSAEQTKQDNQVPENDITMNEFEVF